MISSQFSNKLQGRKDIIILIKDENENLFGGYIGNHITIGQNVHCKNCYLFSLRRNQELKISMFKKKKETGYSYWIASIQDRYLFSFGILIKTVDKKEERMKDVSVFKQQNSSGICQQHCFDYSDKQFALTGKSYFLVKRIIVYQMK